MSGTRQTIFSLCLLTRQEIAAKTGLSVAQVVYRMRKHRIEPVAGYSPYLYRWADVKDKVRRRDEA